MTAQQLVHPTVIDALNGCGIDYEIIECDPEHADTAEFCAVYGYPLETSGNAILVASTRGPKRFAMGVVQATSRLDVNHKMKTLMEVPRASFAKAEETVEFTGMAIGGVTPFGVPAGCPVYIDQTLERLDYLIIGSGTRSAKIKLQPAELLKIPDACFVAGLGLPLQPSQEA